MRRKKAGFEERRREKGGVRRRAGAYRSKTGLASRISTHSLSFFATICARW
jgi:hypothetical protein